MLKQNKFKISAGERFYVVIDFLRKQLRFSVEDSLVRSRLLECTCTPTGGSQG